MMIYMTETQRMFYEKIERINTNTYIIHGLRVQQDFVMMIEEAIFRGNAIGLNMRFSPISGASKKGWPLVIVIKKKEKNYWTCDVTISDRPFMKIERKTEPMSDWGLT